MYDPRQYVLPSYMQPERAFWFNTEVSIWWDAITSSIGSTLPAFIQRASYTHPISGGLSAASAVSIFVT